MCLPRKASATYMVLSILSMLEQSGCNSDRTVKHSEAILQRCYDTLPSLTSNFAISPVLGREVLK